MGKITVSNIRNICLAGHSGCGKTSLAEALLYAAGATSRKGSPAEGTSILDFEEEEKQKKTTMKGAVSFLTWKDVLVHIIDLPGYLDFIGEMIGGMSAVETVFICIDTSAGVKVTTKKVWDLAEQFGAGRVLVLSKIDQNPSDLDKAIEGLKTAFGDTVVPFFGLEGGNVVPLLPRAKGLGKENEQKANEALEKVVETDEGLMEKYLSGEEPKEEEVSRALKKAIITRQLTPVLMCSAERGTGIKEVLDFIAFGCPAADGGAPKSALKGEERVEVIPSEDRPFLAQVFKIMTDPYVGKLAYFRVYAGSFSAGESFVNPRTGKTERVGNLYKIMGKDQKAVERVSAGELGAISKVEEISIGDTMRAADEPLVLERQKFPEPMV
ncbi:MAG: GTP-binding protein, partial [Planctomycetota bacterium]|nr:GTP-binding protein [Planctomycetota bacterium]